MSTKKTYFYYTVLQWLLLLLVVFILTMVVTGLDALEKPLLNKVGNLVAGAAIGLLATLVIAFVQSNQSTKELDTATDALKTLSEKIAAKVAEMDAASAKKGPGP